MNLEYDASMEMEEGAVAFYLTDEGRKARHKDQLATYNSLRKYLRHYYSEKFLDGLTEADYKHGEAYLRFFVVLKKDLHINDSP